MFALLFKGDSPGHPFRGNQYTGGGVDKDVATLYRRAAAPEGGFTYQPSTRNEPRNGFAVSIYPKRSAAFDAKKFGVKDLMGYLKSNRDLTGNHENHIGAWNDAASGKIFLDVSQVKGSAHDAHRLAAQHDQIAYYDLGQGKSIDVNRKATSGGVINKGNYAWALRNLN